jgi:hypothetical protein
MRLRDALWMVVGTALVVALAVADALAVPNTYNTLGAFQTAAGTIILSIDEFDGIGFTDFEISIDRGPYSVSVLPADVGFGLGSQTESDFCEGGAIAGEGCLVVTMNPNGLTFTFDSPINAFGLAFIKANASTIPSVTLNGVEITGSPAGQHPRDRVLRAHRHGPVHLGGPVRYHRRQSVRPGYAALRRGHPGVAGPGAVDARPPPRGRARHVGGRPLRAIPHLSSPDRPLPRRRQ